MFLGGVRGWVDDLVGGFLLQPIFGKYAQSSNWIPFSPTHSGVKIQKKSKPPASWWFQPVWKILVKLDHFPK